MTTELDTDEVIEDLNLVLEERQLKIINDLSFIKPTTNRRERIKRGSLSRKMSIILQKKENSKKLQNQIQVLTPDDKIRIAWDLFTMIVIFFAILILPVDIAFNLESNFMDNFNYFCVGVFSLDIILNFNTAFQSKGQYVKDRYAIAKQYLKFWFWIDLISTFPFDQIIIAASFQEVSQIDEDEVTTTTQQNHQQLAQTIKLLRILKFFRLIKIVRLLRVFKLQQLFAKLEDYIDFSGSLITLYQLFKLICTMLFIAHWLACIWHFIAEQENSSGNYNWLEATNLQNQLWYIKYIASVYWATATMTTVGYGDIVPVTTIEKIFGIIVMLLACCVFAYIMNSIGGIFVKLDTNEKAIRLKLGQANQFMNSNEIPKDLKAMVIKYLEYKYETESTQVNEKEALSVLSSALKDEVLQTVNSVIIKQSEFFNSGKFEKDILAYLPYLLEEQIFGPEECIFLEGIDPIEKENGNNMQDRCLYFLNQGQVQLCIQKTITCLKVLQQGSIFGQLAFFSDKPRSASAFSLDFVYVQILNRKKFFEKLKINNNQNQIYHMIKHIIEIENNYTPLDQKCFGCQESTHFAYECPKLHYSLTREEKKDVVLAKIAQEQITQEQFNKSFIRNFKREKFNSRINQILIEQIIKEEINYVYKNENDSDMDSSRNKYFEDDQITEKSGTKRVITIFIEEIDYDRLCNYQLFFPEYNLDNIISQYNDQVAKNLSILKKKQTLKSTQSRQRLLSRSFSAERADHYMKLEDQLQE